jgi:signal transduction histidine kinase
MSSTHAHVHRQLRLPNSLRAKHLHAFAFFHSLDEESRVLSQFFSDAFAHGETACELIHPDLLEQHLRQLESAGVPVAQAQQRLQLELRSWERTLAAGGHLDRPAMVALIQQLLDERHARGFALTRVVTHMEWALEAGLDVEELLEYAASLDRLRTDHGDPILSSYDLSKWDGGVIADVMRRLPVAIVGNVLHENPFRALPGALVDALPVSTREALEGPLTFDLETLPRAGRELSACLVHLLALPALWNGGTAQMVLDVVLDAVVSMLQLDLIYARLEAENPHDTLYAARIAGWKGPLPLGLASVLAPCINADATPVTIAHPTGQGMLHSVCIPIGLDGAHTLVAASPRPGFPSTSEKLILLLAANQICIGVAQARAAQQRERIRKPLADSHTAPALRGGASSALGRKERKTDAFAALVDAAIAINASGPLQAVLEAVAQRARSVFAAWRASAIVNAGVDWSEASYATSLAETDADRAAHDPRPAALELHARVSRTRQPLRLAGAELVALEHEQHRSASSVMAVALIGESGVNLGLLQLHDKVADDFDEFDEELLIRFAHIASLAIESRLVQERTRALYEGERSARAAAQEALHYNEVFAGILAHDLRSPLNAILTTARVTLRRPESEHSAQPMRRIQSSGERMLRLIEQLLDFTRIRVGGGVELQPSAVDLLELFRSALAEVELAHPDWSVRLHAHGDLHGDWDKDRLNQVICNLVDNAVQHGAREGGLLVDLDGADPEHVQVHVHNQGCIAAANLARLFDPFRGARHRHDASAGLGLGLFIAQQIVHAHAGQIGVESSAANGTTVTVHLPRHAGTSGAVHASGSRSAGPERE